MDQIKFDKSKFDNSWYQPGSILKRSLWYFVNVFFFINPMFPFRRIKPSILKIFGAKIGKNCLIKPGVNIKYPWFLDFGDHVTIGENVWLDNLGLLTIRDQVTISQGVVLINGNHNFKSKSFDLIISEITIEEGAWIGAKSTIAPGVTIGKYAMISMGSVVFKNCEDFGIYKGNPAQLIKHREFTA